MDVRDEGAPVALRTFVAYLTRAGVDVRITPHGTLGMPGTAELQSLVTLEAMSASTPVVLADAMALPHLVRDGRNGYLFTPNDSDDLAKKITQVLELPKDEQLAMGRASREMVEPHSIQGTLQTFEDLYRGASFEDKVV